MGNIVSLFTRRSSTSDDNSSSRSNATLSHTSTTGVDALPAKGGGGGVQPLLTNKKWVLRSYPLGKFHAARDAELVEETIDLSTIPPDQIVIEVHTLSVDAFIRTMLDEQENAAHGAAGIGKAIPALGYGKVLRGNHKFRQGSLVQGLLSASTYVISSSEGLVGKMSLPGISPTASLGVLGISGIAAYVGMFVSPSQCPRRGDTVVVSAAAGAVGCIAAQMAKLCGARVVGVAGGTCKQKYLLEELKLDGAVDYKSKTMTLGEQLDQACPNGIDFFFDNVGGDILDQVLQRINLHSRIVICGAISHYDSGHINNKSLIKGPSHYVKLAEKSSTISGFNMMHYSQFFFKAFRYLLWHFYRGNIVCPEHVENGGIESFARAMELMFEGGHVGRLLVNVKVES